MGLKDHLDAEVAIDSHMVAVLKSVQRSFRTNVFRAICLQNATDASRPVE